MINLLAKRNGFRNEQSKIYSQFDQNERKQKELVKRITQLKEPFLYDRHVYMIDFERFVSKGLDLQIKPISIGQMKLINKYFDKKKRKCSYI